MPITLPTVDLTGASVGTTGSVSFNPAGPTATLRQYTQPAHIQIYNESGCGLNITFKESGGVLFLPAGAWQTITLPISESGFSYAVTYTLSNPNVSVLVCIYYQPGEAVPTIAALGNSPIGGGIVGTNANELVNTGNTPGTIIVNVQPSDAATATWSADNSGNLTIKSDNAGVLTTLLQLIAGPTPAVKLFAVGQQVEVLGNLWADGFSGSSNGIYSNNGTYYGTDGTNTIIAASGTSGTGNTRIQNTDKISLQVPGGTDQVGITSTNCNISGNLHVNSGSIYGSDLSNTIIAATGTSGTGNTRIQNTDQINLQVPGGTSQVTITSSGCSFSHSINLVVGSLGQLTKFSGTGNGTVATGVTNPTAIAFDPCTVSGSSQTIGGTTSSSSVVTTGSGLAWSGTAWHN